MMFTFHIAVTLELIAFAIGFGLIIWSLRNEGKAIQLAKNIGTIVAIVAVLGMLCSTYYGVKYWHEGYFQTPLGMMQGKPMMKEMDSMMMQDRNKSSNY